MEDIKQVKCETCQGKLSQGTDVITLQEGVVGPRGFIPLEDRVFYCSQTCLQTACADVPDDADERIP